MPKKKSVLVGVDYGDRRIFGHICKGLVLTTEQKRIVADAIDAYGDRCVDIAERVGCVFREVLQDRPGPDSYETTEELRREVDDLLRGL